MCLKKSVFLDILNKFPDANVFYTERAKDRRIEFKRVCLIIDIFYSLYRSRKYSY